MSENNSNKKCAAFCLALRFDINELATLLSESTLIRIIKGALLVEDEQSWSIVFSYGAVVHWNVNSEQQTKLHQLLFDHAENPLTDIEEDYLKCFGYKRDKRLVVNDFYIKIDEIYIAHNVEMGDHLVCYGLVTEYAKRYRKLYLYTKRINYNNVVRLYKDIPNIEVIMGKEENNVFIVEPSTLIIGSYNWHNALYNDTTLKFDRFYYNFANVPFEKKFENFYFGRDMEREKDVYYNVLGLKDDEEYIFIHENSDKNQNLNRKYIKENLKIISAEDYKDVSLFDFLYTIEKSLEVHVINSSFRTLIDLMNIKHDKLYYHKYSRNMEHDQPQCQLNWYVIENKIKEVNIFLYAGMGFSCRY